MDRELLSAQGFRLDGRRATELRRINCQIGVMNQVDGSVYLEQGNTKVLVTVQGPQDWQRKEGKSIEIHWTEGFFGIREDRAGMPGHKRTLDWGSIIRECFESIIISRWVSRSQIDIYVNILQTGGGVIPSVINGITLALISAGVPMIDHVYASSIGLAKNTILVDTNQEEESYCSSVIMAILPNSGTVSLLHCDSKFPGSLMGDVIEEGAKAIARIFETLDRELKRDQ